MIQHFESSAPSLHPHYRDFLTTTSGTDFLWQTFFDRWVPALLLKITDFHRPQDLAGSVVRLSSSTYLIYAYELRLPFLDFVTLSPLILRIRLGIKFLFVRLRFRYPFFSPIPHDINLGSRFRVRRQLRPGGLSPWTDGMPVNRVGG